MNDIQQVLDTELQKAQKTLRSAKTNAIQNLQHLQQVLDSIDSGNIVYKSALTRIIKRKRESFYEILREEAIKAANTSVEYAYGPYIQRLEQSISLADIKIKVANKTLVIKIDLSTLGDIHEWGDAVKQVRRNPRNLANRKRKIGGENAAYFYWRTKIYQTERYDATIADQLSLVDNAPFWYLIENGNANPPGFQVVAPAYPKVKAQRFVEKTERRIKEFLNLEIKTLIPELEREWIEFVANKLGLKLTTKLKALIQEYGFSLAVQIDNLKEINKLNVNDIVGKISTERKEFDIIVTSKSLGLRGRLR